jgi:chromosome partitioning protein
VGKYFFVVEEVEDTAPKRATVLTLFTHAGGAGKTSLARDLGYELASRGYRVLLIDADPQANLSAWLGVEVEEPEEETLLQVFAGGELPVPRNVVPGMDLIPSHYQLATGETTLMQKPQQIFSLRGSLKEARRTYDFIFIDSLPSLGFLAVASAMAGDGLIVPVELSRKGLQALPTVFDAARTYARSLEQMGLWEGHHFVRLIVPNGAEGTSEERDILEALGKEVQGVPVAPPLRRRPAVYRKAQRGTPVQLVSKEAAEEVARVGEALLNALGLSGMQSGVPSGEQSVSPLGKSERLS